MNANRMTERSQEAIQAAQSHAIRSGHQEVGPAHLLVSLIEQDDGLVPAVLKRMDVDLGHVAEASQKEVARLPIVSGSGVEAGKIYVTQALHEVLVGAEDEARRLKDEYVSVEHLFLALISTGPISKVLAGVGVT